MRAECFHGIGVEHSAIRAGADRQGGDDIAVVGIENHHRFWVAASGKKNAILEIQCQPSTRATLAGEIVRAGYGELLGVHNRDFFFVFNVDVYMTFAVGRGLFWHSAQVDRAYDRAILGIDDRHVGRAMTQIVDPFVEWVEQNSVRVALHIDGLNHRESLAVKHHDGFTSEETMVNLWIDSDSMSDGIGDFSNRCQSIQIKYGDSAGGAAAWDIQPASSGVRKNIVKSARAAYFGRLQYLIWPWRRGLLGQSDRRQHGDARCKYKYAVKAFHEIPPRLSRDSLLWPTSVPEYTSTRRSPNLPLSGG